MDWPFKTTHWYVGSGVFIISEGNQLDIHSCAGEDFLVTSFSTRQAGLDINHSFLRGGGGGLLAAPPCVLMTG